MFQFIDPAWRFKTTLALLLLSLFFACTAFAPHPKRRPFNCGYYVSDTAAVYKFYQKSLQYIEVKTGEKVVSIGAQNGTMEVQLSFFRPGISWTLQDINARCLNDTEFAKVRGYYEGLFGRKTDGAFSLVLGAEDSTHLPTDAFDRVLLLNTYHELTNKATMLREIRRVLHPGGRLVLSEMVAGKAGEKRKDCGHFKPVEEELLAELKQGGFSLVSKTTSATKRPITFYVLKRNE